MKKLASLTAMVIIAALLFAVPAFASPVNTQKCRTNAECASFTSEEDIYLCSLAFNAGRYSFTESINEVICFSGTWARGFLSLVRDRIKVVKNLQLTTIISLLAALFVLIIILFLLMRIYIKYLQRKITKADADLRSQHEWFRVTLASIGEGVIATDTEGCITFINHIAQELTGFTEARALGKQVGQIFVTKSRETGRPVELPISRVIHDGAIVGLSNNIVLVSRNRTEYSITNSSAPIRDDSGKIIGAVMVFQDITEQKRAEKLQSITYRIAEATNNSTNLQALFRYIHRVLGTIIDTSNFYIALYDDASQMITFPYYVDENPPEPGIDTNMQRKFGKGLTEYAILTGKSLLINREALNTLLENGDIEILGPLCRIWLGTPLKAEKKIIGVMAVQSYSESITYTQKDLEFMEYVSNQVAVAIERKRNEETINHMAYYDPLTDMPNRILFNDRLNLSLIQANRNQELLAVLFLDLDRFKNINDTLGHAIGDKLLQDVALRLKGCLREGDTIARLGGDEFTILLPRLKCGEDAAKVAQKIMDALLVPFDSDGYEFHITTSIGISIYPYDGKDAQNLLKNADTALYRAKEKGRNSYKLYNPSMNATAFKRLSMENQLRRALERGELFVYYQPQVSVETGQMVGVEALVRWNHHEQGIISPADFISLAEDTGLIVQIDEWVMQSACRQTVAWQKLGYPMLKAAVNISYQQFQHQSLPSAVKRILEEAGLEPSNLELELTEGIVMQNLEHSASILNRLKAMGVRIALDDFGTGYSSLSYLKRFPIDTLKIDRSFVHNLTTDANNAIITTSVIALAQSMSRKVVAEGVETMDEFLFLRRHGCEEMQGYLFSPPLPAHELEKLLETAASLET